MALSTSFITDAMNAANQYNLTCRKTGNTIVKPLTGSQINWSVSCLNETIHKEATETAVSDSLLTVRWSDLQFKALISW